MNSKLLIYLSILLYIISIILYFKSDLNLNKPELSRYMLTMNTHMNKLGLSLYHKNRDLSRFYISEIKEDIESIQNLFPYHNNININKLINIILIPQINNLNYSIQNSLKLKLNLEPDETIILYNNLINSCNRCHSATEHEYIKIEFDPLINPFNQTF